MNGDSPALARVLYAEDSLVDREMMQFLLGSLGVEMIAANNGHDALARTEDDDLDLILLDLWLPEISGLQILDKLAQRGCATPAVLITADEEQTLWDLAREKGAAAVVSKPISVDDLRQLLRDLLDLETGGN